MERSKKQKIGLFDNKLAGIVYIVCQIITVLTIIGSIITYLFDDGMDRAKMIEHIALCVIGILCTNIPLVMRSRFKLYIPVFLQIVVMVFILAHFVLGEVYRAYDHYVWFDKLLHTTSGIVIAICGFSVVNLLNDSKNTHLHLSPFFVALFTFCFALAIGYIWELFEYGVDTIFGQNMQRWKDDLFEVILADGSTMWVKPGGAQDSGLTDTMIDMIVNAIGALEVSVVGGIFLKLKSPRLNSILIKSFKNDEKAYAEATEAQDKGFLKLLDKVRTNRETVLESKDIFEKAEHAGMEAGLEPELTDPATED